MPIAWEPVETRQAILQDPAGVLAEWMRSDEYTASYIIITRSQKAENDMFRIMPTGSLDRIERALLDSPEFRLVFGNGDASVFALTGAGRGGRTMRTGNWGINIWAWPVLITASAAGSVLLVEMNSASPARHLLLLWFLTVCPGMAYVQALQVRNVIAEWLMAMALSFVLVSAVAMVMVFAEWRPEQGLNVVAGLTCWEWR